MFIKKSYNILFNDKSFAIYLFVISLLINQYYGNKGVFPMDSFIHFDPAYRILNGEFPIKDYWVAHGIFVDYLQSLFFLIFGVSWKSYVLHASFFNGFLTVATYFIFRNFKLNKYYSLIYSFFFCVLAYPSSGTPFLDHHSAFLSLLGIYCLILAIDKNKSLYWFLLPACFGFAFLSKQVPSAYVILCISLLIIFYALINRKFNCLKYVFISSLTFIITILAIGIYQDISLKSFLVQYIYFPQSIGSDRINNLNLSFNGFIGNFKFIYLVLFPLFYINLKNLFSKKSYIYEKSFYVFLSLIFLTFALIFHQILTKNQIFIFFLIPVLAGFSHIYLKNLNLKHKPKVFMIIVLICFFATSKYHLRFNENRKFHELNNVNFELAIGAEAIDKKLLSLNWITPFSDDPKEDLEFTKIAKEVLTKDNRKKMVLTDHLFFSAILEEKLFSPSRTYDNISYPGKKNKYFKYYKNFFLDKIKKNNIEVIYTLNLDNADESFLLYNFIDRKCITKTIIFKEIKRFELNKC